MKNTDPRVDAYIAKSAPFAKPILRRLRELVHKASPEVEETLKWGMPSFIHRGKILCGMAAFKEHCTFGFWHGGMVEVLRAGGEEAESAMGSFGRLTGLGDLPSDAKMSGYIRKATALTESDVPARPPRARQPATPAPVPPDLAAGLKKNKPAAKTFQAFAPSHRNEYVEWITEARRPETRQKRLETALEWLAEGKRRNWKYENC
ncbi:MAG: YdeI/OmpD-associated family protein [Acidobacteriota bacterium]